MAELYSRQVQPKQVKTGDFGPRARANLTAHARGRRRDSTSTPSPLRLGYANPVPQFTHPSLPHPHALPLCAHAGGHRRDNAPTPSHLHLGYANPTPQLTCPAPPARPRPAARFTPPPCMHAHPQSPLPRLPHGHPPSLRTPPRPHALSLCTHAGGAGGQGERVQRACEQGGAQPRRGSRTQTEG